MNGILMFPFQGLLILQILKNDCFAVKNLSVILAYLILLC